MSALVRCKGVSVSRMVFITFWGRFGAPNSSKWRPQKHKKQAFQALDSVLESEIQGYRAQSPLQVILPSSDMLFGEPK